MNWKELKHEINMVMLDFTREFGFKSNTIILGKKEYEALQGDEVARYMADISSADMYVDGEIAEIWSMKVCRVNEESIVKAGYIA